MDHHQDRLGRRRRPEQERGLRPLHPLLPEEWTSRALRLAMSEADWAQFESLVQLYGHGETTQARAYGRTLARLLREASLTLDQEPSPAPAPLNWMDWERRKIQRLLQQRN